MFGNSTNGPQNDSKYHWTNHVKDKMRYYRISESLVKRVVNFPHRIEEGIAPNTIAVMQARTVSRTSKAKKSNKEEVWVMYQSMGRSGRSVQSATTTVAMKPKRKIITAWRYPGTSPVGKMIPIPQEIASELEIY